MNSELGVLPGETEDDQQLTRTADEPGLKFGDMITPKRIGLMKSSIGFSEGIVGQVQDAKCFI